jgi:hypothetical protein
MGRTDEDREALRLILHRVRHWLDGIEEAERKLLALFAGGDVPTTPPDTGT